MEIADHQISDSTRYGFFISNIEVMLKNERLWVMLGHETRKNVLINNSSQIKKEGTSIDEGYMHNALLFVHEPPSISKRVPLINGFLLWWFGVLGSNPGAFPKIEKLCMHIQAKRKKGTTTSGGVVPGTFLLVPRCSIWQRYRIQSISQPSILCSLHRTSSVTTTTWSLGYNLK